MGSYENVPLIHFNAAILASLSTVTSILPLRHSTCSDVIITCAPQLFISRFQKPYIWHASISHVENKLLCLVFFSNLSAIVCK